VDGHCQALFDAMEKGAAGMPEARRNWVVARVTLDQRLLRIRGKERRGGSNPCGAG